MLVTLLTAVPLPKDLEGNRDPDSYWIYVCLAIMHVGSAVTVLLNQHFADKLSIWKYFINTSMMLINVSVIIWMCM